LIDLHQAADQLGISPRSVRRKISAGALTGYRLGPRSLRVDADEVEALIEASRLPTVRTVKIRNAKSARYDTGRRGNIRSR